MIKSINNMVKKLFRYLVRTLSALLICILIYFVYISIWVKNFNAEQRSAVENIDSEFIQTSPIIRDPNGYFGVAAIINGQYTDTLLFDTRLNIGNGNRCRHSIFTNKSISQNYIE